MSYFKNNYEKNEIQGMSSFEGLKGTLCHEIFQTIIQSPHDKIFTQKDFRIFSDSFILNNFDSVFLLDNEQMNELYFQMNKIFNMAVDFRSKYLISNEIIEDKKNNCSVQINKCVEIETYIKSFVYGFHGFVDIIFEGNIKFKNKTSLMNKKIIFEIKTGKKKFSHIEQVQIYLINYFKLEELDNCIGIIYYSKFDKDNFEFVIPNRKIISDLFLKRNILVSKTLR